MQETAPDSMWDMSVLAHSKHFYMIAYPKCGRANKYFICNTRSYTRLLLYHMKHQYHWSIGTMRMQISWQITFFLVFFSHFCNISCFKSLWKDVFCENTKCILTGSNLCWVYLPHNKPLNQPATVVLMMQPSSVFNITWMLAGNCSQGEAALIRFRCFDLICCRIWTHLPV